MTEAEWLACSDPARVLESLFHKKDRKLRLWLCACCQLALVDSPYEDLLSTIPIVELGADSAVSADDLADARGEIGDAVNEMCESLNLRAEALGFALHAGLVAPDEAGRIAKRILEGWQMNVPDLNEDKESQTQAILLRDIFANPFRPVTFDPAWRTTTAVQLARGMYDSRDFAAMPILADALQDAGCDNADILDHCRGAGPHVRGCWVVDLVLEKE